MIVLNAPEFDTQAIQEFFESKCHKRGLFKRESLEEVTSFPLIWRPFRYVGWLDENEEEVGMSLVDEELASSVSLNQNEQILLWRPRYANVEAQNRDDYSLSTSSKLRKSKSIQKIVDTLIKRRNKAQSVIEELSPEGRGPDPQTAMAFFIPRTPGKLRKREKIADEIRFHHGILVGTSLVSNVSQDSKVASGIIGDRVYVGTYLAEFRNIISDDIRIGVMESPGVNSLRRAWSNGRALTRLTEINVRCHEILRSLTA